MRIASIITVLGLVVCLAAGAMDLGMAAKIGKMTASCGFIAMAIAGGAMQSRYGIAILVALFFSWWGDFFLMYGGLFLYGLIAFFIGHVGYGIAFLAHGVRWKWAAIGLAGLMLPAVVIFPWLNPHLTDDLRIPVYAYITVITLMVALSVGAWKNNGHWLMFAGALLFYVSDILVARQRFVAPSPINPLIGLPLYYGAQMVFAYGVQVMNQRRTGAQA
ncbi:MAG: lysoplasmalogenase [Candidatus Hydrogenedens sp.]|nr:lysoplasmalogenase [Candidatus Hydrogenedens sp.]